MEPINPSNADLLRLEEKVDKLTDAVMRLVVLEERQSNMGERLGSIEQSVASNEKYISKVDNKVERWINRGIGAWAVAALLFAIFEVGVKVLK